jgi:septum formation protein
MIVLASQSASRKAMLEAAGVAFEAVPAQIDERALEQELAEEGAMAVALAIAEAKASAVSAMMPERLVLGSDSLVTLDDRRFAKPASREQAGEHLQLFSGKWLELHSTASLARGGRQIWYHYSVAALLVRELSDTFIESYLDAEWPAVSGCVGVFRIEGRGAQLFTTIEGDYFTVLGMPLLPVLEALRSFGELER